MQASVPIRLANASARTRRGEAAVAEAIVGGNAGQVTSDSCRQLKSRRWFLNAYNLSDAIRTVTRALTHS